MFDFVKNIFNKKEQVPEKLQNIANYAGYKLAFYLNACNLTEVEKDKAFKILENKSYKEILEIIDNFELLYAEGKTAELNQKFEEEIKKVKEKFDKKEMNLEKQTLTEMKDLFVQAKVAAGK